jgi:GH3 auxin-responsive promoter
MNGWAAITGAARAERARLDHAGRDLPRSQTALLRKILADNAGSTFGRAHNFDHIDTVERFRARVPVRDYEGLRPWIERVAAGKAGVLTTAPVIAFEETGGSTSGRKLVPYTQASLAAFRAAVLPWLADLADERPGTFAGRAYVALSPVARDPSVTAGGLPIGLPSEGAYLGADLAYAFAAVLAVPVEVAKLRDVEQWRFCTLRHLIAAADLSFISVWSPTFLAGLVEALPALAESLLRSIGETDPARARLVETALSRHPIDTPAIWPRLATMSAWADGASRGYAQKLQEMFPHALLQPKGLMATEGAVTIPRRGSPHPAPALTSAFLEFIDDAGKAFTCDELADGETYRVVMTTPGGLYRYDLGDRVTCRGHAGGLPRLEFMGRAVATDIVGEKLSEDFVAAALSRVGAGACLAARASEAPFYELLIDAGPGEDLSTHAALVEECLRANPQYAYARALGQLGPVKPRAVEHLLDRYTHVQARRGCRLADIKPPVLIGDIAYTALIGANPLGASPQ